MDTHRIHLHTLLIDRTYHEDNLLSQRTYNFVTINAFLATALALSFTGDVSTVFGYIIIFFGLALAFFQVFIGKRTVRAIHFWREYTHRVENQFEEDDVKIDFDRKLFKFYTYGDVDTPVGKIVVKPNEKPMYETFPWNLKIPCTDTRLIPSVNTVIGTVIPVLVTLFWFLILITFVYQDQPILAFILLIGGLIASLAIVAFSLRRLIKSKRETSSEVSP